MRPLALLLALVAAGLPGAEEAKPKVITATPVERPLPNEQTKLPWHMVNLWWTMPATPDFESLEIDVTISDDVDPAKLNLYIAPIGLGHGEQVPVIQIDGEHHDFWRVDPERFRSSLEKHRQRR